MYPRKRFAIHRLAPSQLVALTMFLLTASSTPAQRMPLPPQEQEEVNNAIDRGVAYLKRTQEKNGTWANPRGNWAEARFHGHYYAIGFTALPALTLLECGVPADDPIIQQAAHFVRSKAGQLDRTYELSLAVLFLDRLGDPSDKKIIQTFALRLIAGQSATGGWGYKCPLLNPKVQTDLLTALRHLDSPDMLRIAERGGKKPADLKPTAQLAGAPKLEGAIFRPDAPPLGGMVVQPGSLPLSGSTSRGSPGEESSLSGSTMEGSPKESPVVKERITQSPKSRHDCLGLSMLDEYVPEHPEPEPMEKVGQKPDAAKPDGKADPRKSTKSYAIPERLKALAVIQEPGQHVLQDPLNRGENPFMTTTDNSNTQFAILALWRAQQYDVPTKRSLNLIVRRYLTSQNGDGSWGYHYQYGGGGVAIQMPNSMICVGLIGLAVGHGLAQARPAGQVVQDARIVNGLIALSGNIGQPVEERGKLAMQNLYFLWSLERVAVLYNLPTIGEKDWYRWGAQVLVRNQQLDGNWAGGLYIGSKPPIDTCLALLFLKRANLVKDLTAKLPFSPEDLNSRIIEKTALTPKQSELPKETKKPSRPIETPKPKEPETVATEVAPQTVKREEMDNSTPKTSSKKVWLVLSVVVFVIFSGGSLVFILLAMNRRSAAPVSRDAQRSAKTSRSAARRG